MQAPDRTLAEWRQEAQAAKQAVQSANDDIKSDEQWLEKVRRNVTQREKQVQENKQFVKQQTERLKNAQRHIAMLEEEPGIAYLRFNLPLNPEEHEKYLEKRQQTAAEHPTHKKARQDAFEHTPQKQQQAIVISDDDSMQSVSDVEDAGQVSDGSMEEVPDDQAAQLVPAFSDGRWHSEVQTELEKLEKRQQVEKADKELLKKLPYQEVITLLQDMLDWCSKFPDRKFVIESTNSYFSGPLHKKVEDEKFYVEFRNNLFDKAQKIRDKWTLEQCSYASGDSYESDHQGAMYQYAHSLDFP